MNYLSLALIIKNEAPYLQDFINYYLKQGIEHIYLFNNESEDNSKEIVKPWIDSKVVSWFELPGVAKQKVAYEYVIKHHKHDTEWCLFVDADEYVYSTKNTSFVDTLANVYDRLDISGVGIHWLLFGDNYHEKYTPEPDYIRFTMREDCVNQHIKSVVRLREVNGYVSPHAFTTYNNVVDEHFNVIPDGQALVNPATADILRCNHYVIRSKEECFKKRTNARRADNGTIRDVEQFYETHNHNIVRDTDIWKVI